MRWIYEDEYIEKETEEDPRSVDHSLCGTYTKGSVYVCSM